jgi:hypothetical protein
MQRIFYKLAGSISARRPGWTGLLQSLSKQRSLWSAAARFTLIGFALYGHSFHHGLGRFTEMAGALVFAAVTIAALRSW